MGIRCQLGLLGLLTLLAGASTGCNLFGGFDDPDTVEETIREAQAKMEAGDCASADKLMANVQVRRDDVYQLKGWIKMCGVGASLKNLGTTLFAFSTSATDLKIIGDLANTLIPSDTNKINTISGAIEQFEQMSYSNERQVYVALGAIVKASALIAKQAAGSKVFRSDISAAACSGQNCTGGGPTCTAGMSDSEANSVALSLDTASAALGSSASGFGAIQELAKRLGTDTDAATGAVTRCTIYNSMLRE